MPFLGELAVALDCPLSACRKARVAIVILELLVLCTLLPRDVIVELEFKLEVALGCRRCVVPSF